MHDLRPLDERLSGALRRYADSAVRPRDAMAIARTAHATATATTRVWRRQRALATAVGLALLLALALAALATVGQQLAQPAAFAPGSIAFTRAGALFVADADGHGERLLARVDSANGVSDRAFSFAPDRSALAYAVDDSHTQIIDVDGRTVGAVPGCCKRVSWAPDSQRLAAFPFGHQLAIQGLDGEVLEHLPLTDVDYDHSGAFSIAWWPDGRWIAVAACRDLPGCKFDHDWLLVATDGSGTRWLKATGPYNLGRFPWTSDPGARLADLDDPTGWAQVLTPDDGPWKRLDGAPLVVDEEWWSPDGSRLLVQGQKTSDAAASQLAVVDGTGTWTMLDTEPVVLEDGSAGWSGDGQRVLFEGTTGGSPGTPRGGVIPPLIRGLWSIDATGGTPMLLVAGVDDSWFDVATGP